MSKHANFPNLLLLHHVQKYYKIQIQHQISTLSLHSDEANLQHLMILRVFYDPVKQIWTPSPWFEHWTDQKGEGLLKNIEYTGWLAIKL